MKRYLLTWYGITDLRAALGYEEHGGPVLGALRSGKYTDVLVLAYTNPGKAGPAIEDAQKQWVDRQHPVGGQSPVATPIESALALVDAFANTPAGHAIYKKWLRREIEALGLAVNVTLCVKELASLNDSKGIYDAALKALDIVLSQQGERSIAFYLSPGTPVMAFTWAFLALTNPDISIEVIACSDYRNPPEEIQLPYDLLAPSNRRARHFSGNGAKDFDVVFHMFGEQRLPSIFGILQFPCLHHIFVASENYPPDIMRKFIPTGAKYEWLRVNPFDPMSVKLAVLKALADLPPGSRVGFNLTGGTKLMFAGAIAACRKVDGIPFYFETRDHNLLFLHDYTTMPMRGIDTVDAFFQANGYELIKSGRWEECDVRRQRISLTNWLWKERNTISKYYRMLEPYADYEGSAFIPFSIPCQVGRRLELSLDKVGRARLCLDKTEFVFRQCPDFAKYLSGGWLEEYTYLLLEPLLRSGRIRDLRIGIEVSWASQPTAPKRYPAQEFDVVLTDGKRLYIIECKAGNVLSDHVQKLQNCVRNYGGVDARGILVSAFPPHHPVTRKRIETAVNLSSLHGWDVTNKLEDTIFSEERIDDGKRMLDRMFQ